MKQESGYFKYKKFAIELTHFLFSIGTFFIFFLLFRFKSLYMIETNRFRYNLYAAAGYGVLLYFFYKTYNAYLFGYNRIRTLVFSQILSQTFSLILIYLAISFSWKRFDEPLVFIPMLVIQVCFDCIWSYLGNTYYYKSTGILHTLLVYKSTLDKKRFGTIKGKPTERIYVITNELQYDGDYEGIKDRLKGYDAIFVAGVNSECRNGILQYCKEEKIPGFFLPHVGDIIMQSAIHVQSFDTPVLYVNKKELEPEYAVIKRLFDIVVSGLALILLSPLMLITGLAVKLYDGGPALYKQTRLTKNGKSFRMLKFRSMRVDAEKDGVARLSSGKDDDRITPVGTVIRRFRLDEIPQLWNIFIGDMSVVGPRPERPEIAELYAREMPEFNLRLQVKAGLTGYAQVYGKYNTTPYDKLGFDLLYINNMNVFVDIQLCFATFAILFKPESTKGIGIGQTTAMDYDEAWEKSKDQ